MDIKLSHTFLAVDDPDKAVEFYRDVLGLEIRDDVRYGKMRWVTIGSPSQPEVDIVLEPPAVNPNMSAEDRSAVADLMAKGVYGRIVFWTDSCDATFERVNAPTSSRSQPTSRTACATAHSATRPVTRSGSTRRTTRRRGARRRLWPGSCPGDVLGQDLA
jgi:Glyoxalase/Bleomycin resistance protein/Dioxygenase superfamily